MISNFFSKQTKRKTQCEQQIDRVPVKKSKKRNELTAFSKTETPNRTNNMKKREPSGNWRCFKEIEINHSLISKDWAYDEKAYSKLYICPYGMVKTLTKLYSHRKNYHAFNVLPDLVKTNLSIKEKDYSVEKMSLTISDFGNLGIKKFSYIYCIVCNNDIIPCFIKENSSKLPENATIIDVLSKWDKLDFPVNYLNLAGCLIPNEQHIHAGPNGRRYILRPTEHVCKCTSAINKKQILG